MRIYLSGSISERPRCREIKQRLITLGHIVVSTWHDDDIEAKEGTFEERSEVALINWRDFEKATTVVVLVNKDRPQRGVHAEIGGAIVKGLPVHASGHHSDLNTMCVMPNVRWYANDEALMKFFA